jgi:hypothetical protein
LKEKSKLRKHRKVRKRAEAKRNILEQEHNLQVEKVKSKKSPDLNQWSNIKENIKPNFSGELGSNEL